MLEIEQRWQQQARRATFEDYRRRGVTTWIAPRGASMRPLVGRDTWMQVEFGAAEVRRGDIVLFPLGEILVAHRVVALHRRAGQATVIAKGDAEPFCDPPVQLGGVIGVVRALRQGQAGQPSSFGCTGAGAGRIASVSRWHGRSAQFARRAAAKLPDPLRRVALPAIPPFARVVARILFAVLPWAARLSSLEASKERR